MLISDSFFFKRGTLSVVFREDQVGSEVSIMEVEISVIYWSKPMVVRTIW